MFLQIPWEYGGMGTPLNKKWEAILWFLEKEKKDEKFWTPIILNMAQNWISAASEKSKNSTND